MKLTEHNKAGLYMKWVLVMSLAALCNLNASAALRPRADVGIVNYRTDRHPLSGEYRIEVSVTTRQQGDFFGHIVMYAELEDDNDKEFFATGRAKFPTHNGDLEYLREIDCYIIAGKKPKLKAYWIGYYYIDSSGEYLLDSKDSGVSDVDEWLEEMKSLEQIKIDMGGAALPSDLAGVREALLTD